MTHRGWVLSVLMLLVASAVSGCLSGDGDEKDVKTPDTGDTSDDATDDDDTAEGSGGTGGSGTTPGADPVAPIASFAVNLTQITPGVEVGFDAANSTDADTDAANLTFSWDFDDGSTGEGINTTHVFAAAGVYNVTLNVTDPEGLSNETTQAITVIDGFTGGVFNTLTGTIAVPDPLLGPAALLLTPMGSLPCATNLECAKLLGAPGQQYMLFDVVVPTGAAYVKFEDSGNFGLHVFRADTGARLGGTSQAVTGNPMTEFKNAVAFEHLNWVAMVFSPTDPANAFEIAITALAEAPA